MIRSILLIFVGVSITAFFCFWAVVFSLLGAGESRIHKLVRLWARILLSLSSIPVEISGWRHVLLDSPQIFAANHQSDVDTLVALAWTPVPFRWIAKEELFKIPLFGAAMRNAGYIPINRRDHDSALKSLDEAAQIIRKGSSVMTFPEGTRSGDGTIQPFKQGVFYLAIQAGVPVVPVTIIGSGAIMGKRSLKINPGGVKLIFDKPIDANNYSIENRHQLIEEVRNTILENYRKYSSPSGSGFSAQNAGREKGV
ncbi:1-acyl-sn-glycerol-3-phosphate acyltransferase [Syntrophus gentianae]|uniref:1-acyl-sn-glycerol-3-phosphate acyltransferase n=1 Tax=Syntrophus gentianae TaxID=43775 RepID=A0A1H7UUG9_9BACT|nr:lysophospholipid acyltransferase family protein [Syntrophus gentianae]SEM00484.1 1-acyl-sn-glycerol-3-phosphate acyltransferase [Syntrophus gentianae]